MRPTHQTRPRRWIALAVRTAGGAALLAGGAGVYVGLVSTRPAPPTDPQSRAAMVVEVVEASEIPVARRWIGTGEARPLREADVEAEVAGVVRERPEGIDAGEPIQEGDLIVGIDARDYQEALEAAQQAIASLEAQIESLDVEQESLEGWVALAEEEVQFARRELNRALAAQEKGVATQSEIDSLERELRRAQRIETEVRQRLSLIPPRRQDLRSQLRRLRAEAEQTKLSVERSRIVSPIDGVLQKVEVRVGERVAVGEPVARVVNLSEIEVPLRLPMSAGAEIETGSPATIEADGPSGLTWSGRVARVAPEADPRTRTLTMFVEIEQPSAAPAPGMLLPGQFVVGRVTSPRVRDRVIVPRRAVQGDRVFVATGDPTSVERREVTIAHYLEGRYESISTEDTEWAVIADGLSPGERVVVSNLQDLEAGAIVEVESAGTTEARGSGDGAVGALR